MITRQLTLSKGNVIVPILLRSLQHGGFRKGHFITQKKQFQTKQFQTNRLYSSSTTTDGDENHVLLQQYEDKNEGSNSSTDSFISILKLNRPKANAMGFKMLHQLQECLSTLEGNEASPALSDEQRNVVNNQCRCVVLTSYSNKVFSAGADLKERSTMTQDETSKFVTELRNTMNRLSKLPMPVIAAIEGVAVGGGLELALAADIRVAGQNASVGLPETSLAIVPGAGGTQRLPRLIGVARAKELIFTGRRIDAAKGFDYGLIQHVVDAGDAEKKAIEIAKEIVKNGPLAIRAAKRAVDDGIESPKIESALEIERQCYQLVIPSSDRLEGLTAFKEGRTPNYLGK